MSTYRIVPDRLVTAMLEDTHKKHRRSKIKKIFLCLSTIISLAIIALLSFSCTSTGAIVREVRCGIGKDYICTTHFADKQQMHMICACRTKM